jgi:hypothetical protein
VEVEPFHVDYKHANGEAIDYVHRAVIARDELGADCPSLFAYGAYTNLATLVVYKAVLDRRPDGGSELYRVFCSPDLDLFPDLPRYPSQPSNGFIALARLFASPSLLASPPPVPREVHGYTFTQVLWFVAGTRVSVDAARTVVLKEAVKPEKVEQLLNECSILAKLQTARQGEPPMELVGQHLCDRNYAYAIIRPAGLQSLRVGVSHPRSL